MVVSLILMLSSVTLASANITGTYPEDGACFCLTGVKVNARDEAGLTTNIIASVSTGECYTYSGKRSVTKDGHDWFLVNHHRKEVWITGDYLKTSPSEMCAEEFESSWQACTVIACVEGIILLLILVASLVFIFKTRTKRLDYQSPTGGMPLVAS